MKRKITKIILSLSILFLTVAMFVGCGEIFSPMIDESPAAETPASGTENVPDGEILVIANLESAENSDRSAIPTDLFDVTKFKYFAKIVDSSKNDITDLKEGTLSDSKLTFRYNSVSQRNNISLEVYAAPTSSSPTTTNAISTAVLFTSESISISDDNTITINKLSLKPYETNIKNGTGTVSLKIKVPAGYTLTYSCAETAFSDNVELTGTSPNYELKTESGKTVSANSYTLIFTLTKGDSVYAWTEIITVINGLETNSWLSFDGTYTDNDVPKEITTTGIQELSTTTLYVRGSDFSASTKSWYTTNLNSATADNDNPGTLMKPLATVQAAIDKVKEANATAPAGTEFTIYVAGEFTASSGANVADFSENTKDLDISIIGLGTETAKSTLKGNGNRVILILSTSKTNLTLKNLVITGGNANKTADEPEDKTGNGGGIYFNGGSSNKKLTIKKCDIKNNGSTSYGGGIYTHNAVVEINQNSTITENSTNKGGGLCYHGNAVASSITLELEDCIINKNTAVHGAGIAIYDGTITFKNNTIIGDSSLSATATSSSRGNFCTGNGGGVMITNEWPARVPVLTIKNGCSIIGNYSSNGGGICIQGGASVTMESGVKVQYNAATTGGGGIHTTSALTIPNGVEISGNSATNGGGICLENSTLTISGTSTDKVLIKNNTAQCGGGIYIFEKDDAQTIATITNCVISGNSVEKTLSYNGGTAFDGGKGGGIYIGGNNYTGKGDGKLGVNPDVRITDTTIKSNSTNFYGGGIINFGKLTLKGCTLGGTETAEGNTAGIAGGGMYNNGNTTIEASSKNELTLIVGNKSNSNGGGIVNSNNGTLILKASEFSNNSAVNFGKDVFNTGVLKLYAAGQIGGDVYLGKGNSIIISESLTKSPAATITPEKYPNESGYVNAAVLTAETGVTLENEVVKFKVTPSSSKSWKVNSTGYLEELTITKFDDVTTSASLSAFLNESSNFTNNEVTIEVKVTDDSQWKTLVDAIQYAYSTSGNTNKVNLILSEECTATEIPFRAFTECQGLKSIEILPNADPNENSITTIESYAFGYPIDLYAPCGIESIILSKNVTTIDEYAFYGAYELETVVIPSDSDLTTIGDSAFEDCFDLTSITLPDSLETIGDDAFYNVTKVKAITIPKNVSKIGYHFFCYQKNSYTTSLEQIVFAEPSGWYVTPNDAYTEGRLLQPSDLSDPVQNVKNFLGETGCTENWSEMYFYRNP